MQAERRAIHINAIYKVGEWDGRGRPSGERVLVRRFMFDEMYYEENNVIPEIEYRYILDTLQQGKNFKPARASVVRKIFFNKDINYLTDAMSVSQENSENYCIVMTDWETGRLVLERKSVREGLICKSHLYLSEEQFEMIVDGEYEWMKDSHEGLLRDFYRQLTINQIRPGVVVDYTRQSFRMNNRKEYMIFDTSIKSTYLFTKDTLLSPLLEQAERLQAGRVVMTYKQAAEMQSVILHLMGINQPKQQLLPEMG